MGTDKLTIESVRAFTLAPETVAMRAAVRAAKSKLEEEVAYVAPIHARLLAAAALKDGNGDVITDMDRLYLCKDDEGVGRLFDSVDVAHQENGRDLERGYCPKLIAEGELRDRERELRKAACEALGIPEPSTLKMIQRLDAILIDTPEGR